MFEAFTDEARHVVVLAQEEARSLNHDHIGTEHMLLGVLHGHHGVAVEALRSLGVSQEMVRQQVQDLVGRGAKPPSGHIPFTPRAKKIMELSLRESRQLGSDRIDTEHVLLGLLREGAGVAVQVLATLGVEPDRVRQRVLDLTSEGGRGEREPATETGFGAPGFVLGLGSRRTRRLLRDFTAVLEENDALRDEVKRLRRLLKARGIDPQSA